MAAKLIAVITAPVAKKNAAAPKTFQKRSVDMICFPKNRRSKSVQSRRRPIGQVLPPHALTARGELGQVHRQPFCVFQSATPAGPQLSRSAHR